MNNSDQLATKILKNFNKEEVKTTSFSLPEKKEKEYDSEFNVITPRTNFRDIILSKEVYHQIESSLDLIKLNKAFFKMNSSLFDEKKYLAYNLYGESGTGKTETAKAIASYYKKDILMVNYSQLLSKFIGETGKNIKKYFDYAKENDLVLFFDEADTLVANRQNSLNNNSQDTNIFMQNIDTFEGIVILTTNKFQDYDKAMMRRFINIKYNLPDKKMRNAILKKYMKNIPLDFNLLSEKSENLSGGEIVNALKSSYGKLARNFKKEYPSNYTEKLKNTFPTEDIIVKEFKIIRDTKNFEKSDKKISL